MNRVWFADRLMAKRISQRRLSTLLGMDPSAVSLMLSGKRKMSALEASDVARALGVPVEEVLRHAGIPVPVNGAKSVPVVGSVGEDGVVTFGRTVGPRTTLAPSDVGDGCQALRVLGDGLLEGWLVFYRPMEGVSLEAVGRLCLLELADGGSRLAIVGRGYEPGWHTLTGLAGRPPLHMQLASAAPVLWMKQ